MMNDLNSDLFYYSAPKKLKRKRIFMSESWRLILCCLLLSLPVHENRRDGAAKGSSVESKGANVEDDAQVAENGCQVAGQGRDDNLVQALEEE